ncbi:unnamed protein product, partial [Ectocarpus sp. 12 AP-2014]
CCGANEFIKLHAYTLTQYHRVMHVDADTLMLHPMDELMGMHCCGRCRLFCSVFRLRPCIQPNPPSSPPSRTATPPTESKASLVYTTDPAMATKGSKALPVQGGFLLVRPDLGVYDELRAIVREARARCFACHAWGT